MGTILLGAALTELGKQLGGFAAKELIGVLKRAKDSCGEKMAKCLEQNKEKSTEELLNMEISPEMNEYVNEYINNEVDEDYGITEDNLYINFDENKELEYDEDVEKDICQMKDALNHLLAAFGSNNKIVRHLFY